MSELIVNLNRNGRYVYIHTLDIPEELRKSFDFTASNGVHIVVGLETELYSKTVRLCLDTCGRSHTLDSRTHSYPEEATAYYQRIKLALTEAKAEMKRLQAEPQEIPDDCDCEGVKI